MSNIELVRIDENNFIQAFNLKLAKEQEQFVSNPIRSLAQAYVYYNQCIPFGIFNDDTMVGYVMVIYDYDLAEYNIWHMMIDIAYQHPLFFSGTLHSEFKQVRTFPYTILRSKAFAKSAVQSPVLQIRRAEYQHLVVKSMGEEQIPFSGSCVPEHIRVASLTFKSDYRIAGIYLKRHSVVFTMGKALYLACSRRSI